MYEQLGSSRICSLAHVAHRFMYFLSGGYNANNDAKGAKPEDFFSFCERCLIEGIDYQPVTGVIYGKDRGNAYHCDVTWRYDIA
eukprot:CAMPEP_0201920504 /NCGR_PEP_ID=MMETSP0903-20130614/9108_1 /ASSEMBLY_ACC=CAM_ASM_000552 /TAXON_ID=420261 /ORGANISM="Thalassiosira antarctica, Strain CCMP982" /LENGTH=83 /DNA_ID=CAMNT_0048457279 /DNA_START=164 /DNA_END=411 /DNA_ORIENTATION=-